MGGRRDEGTGSKFGLGRASSGEEAAQLEDEGTASVAAFSGTAAGAAGNSLGCEWCCLRSRWWWVGAGLGCFRSFFSATVHPSAPFADWGAAGTAATGVGVGWVGAGARQLSDELAFECESFSGSVWWWWLLCCFGWLG